MAKDWIGEIGGFKEAWLWIDCMLLLIFGGIPWQVYFQRVLSSKTSSGAQRLSFVAGVGCLLMAIPPALIGAIARNTDWRMTDYSPWNNGTKVEAIPEDKRNMVVPLVFQYLTPKWVAFIGLGAVSAAVMSSADSSVLSAASMFAHNIWKLTIRPHASEKEVILVMRFAIIAVGIMATVMALTIQIGLVLRLVGGEPLLGLPALVHFPMYTDGIQYFPFKSIAMLASLFTILGVSRLSEHLFKAGHLSPELDVLGCVVVPPERIPLPSDVSFNVSSDTLAMNKANGNGTNNATFTETSFLHPSYADQNYLSTNSR
ncbi:unnamed protein product [Strongylus vulgaris]|uniref:Uncharacterized protein n=1 Tax=Strongylus vulgaris TaxID=40348 RepID=A0A3P7L2N3_STRVU|nr:unnamed protein product [Strongylus vulgaris]